VSVFARTEPGFLFFKTWPDDMIYRHSARHKWFEIEYADGTWRPVALVKTISFA